MKLNTVKEAIEDIKKGKIIIIADSKERENEGDLFAAAERVTPEIINFMATNGRGLVCAPISMEIASRLDLNMMVDSKNNTESHSAKFTVSIDAKTGTTTGISASDRAETIRMLVNPNAKPEDFRTPGHIFPLIAEDSGVMKRGGHTEAAVDLARIAGLKPAGAICEIMNEDGTMACGMELEEFAQRHHLKIITIEEIIKFRAQHENFTEKVADAYLPTRFGSFRTYAYKNTINSEEHIALVKGDIRGRENVPVRVHSSCMTGEIFGSLRCDCESQLHTAMAIIGRGECGIITYLDQEGRGIGLINKLKAYKLQDMGFDTVDANKMLGLKSDYRDYLMAAQILRDLGVASVRLLSNNPDKKQQLESYGIRIKEMASIETVPSRHNISYLNTKKEKMMHIMDVNEKLVFL